MYNNRILAGFVVSSQQPMVCRRGEGYAPHWIRRHMYCVSGMAETVSYPITPGHKLQSSMPM